MVARRVELNPGRPGLGASACAAVRDGMSAAASRAGPSSASDTQVKQEHASAYAELRDRLLPRLLRRQTQSSGGTAISEGTKALKQKIEELDRAGDDVGVYNLLLQIDEYEKHPTRYTGVPPAMRLHAAGPPDPNAPKEVRCRGS